MKRAPFVFRRHELDEAGGEGLVEEEDDKEVQSPPSLSAMPPKTARADPGAGRSTPGRCSSSRHNAPFHPVVGAAYGKWLFFVRAVDSGHNPNHPHPYMCGPPAEAPNSAQLGKNLPDGTESRKELNLAQRQA